MDSKNFSAFLQSKLLNLFLDNKVDLIWIFIASSIANLLMLTPMLYMLQIFDRIFISKSVLTLLTVSGIIIFFYLTSALSSYIRAKIIISIGLRLEKKINERLFNVSFKERLRNNEKNPGSYLDDLTMVRQWLTGAAVFAVFDLPWVPLYVLIMFIMHPILGYTSLILILILIILGLYFSNVLGNQDEILRQEETETNDFLYGKLRNSEILSVYALASNFKEQWKENKQNFYISFSQSQKKTDFIQNSIKQYRFLSNSLALTVGAFLVINGELTLGSMIAASMLMARTTQPVDMAASTLSRITVVREAFWRLENMLSISSAMNIVPGIKWMDNEQISSENKINSILLENVNVAYSGSAKKVFENLNLSILGGEITAIVGPTGVGKTTLVKLLAGLVPYEGIIKYDDIQLKDFSSKDAQNLIGYLPQDVLMIPGSVAENISGLRSPDSQRVVAVAKLAGIHDFILKFPQGYDTNLIGGNQNLSGGERQRLGLARSIYNNPACIFLDEPNSALDHSGELALKNVVTHCKNEGKLVVIVTHRRSVLAYSDKIVDLSDKNKVGLIGRDEYISRFSSKDEFDKRFTF